MQAASLIKKTISLSSAIQGQVRSSSQYLQKRRRNSGEGVPRGVPQLLPSAAGTDTSSCLTECTADDCCGGVAGQRYGCGEGTQISYALQRTTGMQKGRKLK